MVDPLSDVIRLLAPRAVFTKGISGAGGWGVRYSDFGHPSFAIVVEGSCRLTLDGQEALVLQGGDFVLLPTTPGFTISGLEPVPTQTIDPHAAAGDGEEVRHGRQDGPPDVRILGGYFVFDSENTGLLVPLLPAQIHVRGVERMSTLVRLLVDESASQQSGRDLVLNRLIEILLVEALRSSKTRDAATGLLHGLDDPRVSLAIGQIHADPARAWTIADLAKECALSRSAFFDRFTRIVGLTPTEYLLGWRMALAKDLLRGRNLSIDEVAERVGYVSASTFSTAFSRHVGQPPRRYSRIGVSPIAANKWS